MSEALPIQDLPVPPENRPTDQPFSHTSPRCHLDLRDQDFGRYARLGRFKDMVEGPSCKGRGGTAWAGPRMGLLYFSCGIPPSSWALPCIPCQWYVTSWRLQGRCAGRALRKSHGHSPRPVTGELNMGGEGPRAGGDLPGIDISQSVIRTFHQR